MLKVAMVGVGGISGSHIRGWKALDYAEIVAMCDIRPERMEGYPECRHYTDFDDMLEKEELDIIDICLPTYLHVDFAVKAMERGIHVMVEKPISLRREDVARAYNTAKEHNVKFMVAQVLRWWPEYLKLKEFVDTGVYGKVLSGVMQRLGYRPTWSWDGWMTDEKRSGLVPYDLHIHDLDFLVYTFGKPADYRVHRSKRPEQDYINVTYDFGDFFVQAESAWYASTAFPFQSGFRFQFEKALVVKDANGMRIYDTDGNLTDLTGGDESSGDINLPKTSAHAEEVWYFAACVRDDKPADRVKPEELETVIDILDSMN